MEDFFEAGGLRGLLRASPISWTSAPTVDGRVAR